MVALSLGFPMAESTARNPLAFFPGALGRDGYNVSQWPQPLAARLAFECQITTTTQLWLTLFSKGTMHQKQPSTIHQSTIHWSQSAIQPSTIHQKQPSADFFFTKMLKGKCVYGTYYIAAVHVWSIVQSRNKIFYSMLP